MKKINSPISLEQELFFKTLDPQKLHNSVNNLLQSFTDGELFLEYNQNETIVLENHRIREASLNTHQGMGLRGVMNDTFAYAHSSDLSHRSFDFLANILKTPSIEKKNFFNPFPSSTHLEPLYSSHNPLAAHEFKTKVRMLQDLETYALDNFANIVHVNASLLASWQVIKILKTFEEQGNRKLLDARPLVRLNVSIIVKDPKTGRQEIGYHGMGGRYGYDQLLMPDTWKSAVREAYRQADVNLSSVEAPAGEFPVLLGPGFPGVLLHEAIGHGLEGDFNRKKSSAFSNLMHQPIASPHVTVIDDGTLENRRGSLTFDDEGTPTQKTVLIEKGVLVEYMNDRLNARLMNRSLTGNGRRESYAHPPLPRMTNTYMLGGSDKKEDLIASMDKGIYAVNFGGGQVDIVSGKFVFQTTEAYLIEKGKIIHPLKNVMLIGSGPEVLKHVQGISHDMSLDTGVGTCGKDGQSVPCGVGQPTLLIDRSITVGGADI